MVLTDTTDGEQSDALVRRLALGEEGLQHVHAERQSHDRLRTRSHDHALDPQTYERHERSERFHDVRIVGPGLGDHTSQLGVAIRSHLKQ